jgi:lipopolysaccharide export system ATP-binding protein
VTEAVRAEPGMDGVARARMPLAVLRADGLVKSFRSRKVVKGVSVEVAAGEVVGLLGPNGAGKTTIFDMIVGLMQPDEGTITLNGEPITALPMFKRARSGIGYLPQESSVFRRLSVQDNILAILEMLDYSRSERAERVDALLNELDLGHIRTSMAYALSGGERRRLEITRALATNPTFMLLDEPFAGIDPIAVADIQQIIIRLKGKGIGILITDHNVRETLAITDRAYILYDGKILVSGTASEIANNPIAREIYLGEKFAL